MLSNRTRRVCHRTVGEGQDAPSIDKRQAESRSWGHTHSGCLRVEMENLQILRKPNNFDACRSMRMGNALKGISGVYFYFIIYAIGSHIVISAVIFYQYHVGTAESIAFLAAILICRSIMGIATIGERLLKIVPGLVIAFAAELGYHLFIDLYGYGFQGLIILMSNGALSIGWVRNRFFVAGIGWQGFGL